MEAPSAARPALKSIHLVFLFASAELLEILTVGTGDAKGVPRPVVKRTICQESGKIASSECTNTRSDYFKNGTQPMKYCSAEEHIVLEENPENTSGEENGTGEGGVIDGNATEPGNENIQNQDATPGSEANESDGAME